MQIHPVDGDPGLPLPDRDALARSEQVLEHVRKRIDSADGWIPFADYMEFVLYASGLGYYVAGAHKFGKHGDFTTAPEISPLFGRTLARQVAQILKVTGSDVLELGAGSGALAVDVLTELDRIGCLPERYCILEVSAELAQRQRIHLERAIPALAGRVEWLSALPGRITGVVLANEVLDALPVHIVAWREQGLFERGVTHRHGVLAWDERPADAALFRAIEGITVSPPYVSEIGLAAQALVASLSVRIDRGAMLLIDYGFGRREYYHPQRATGTLMCHYRHRVHDDPFFLPGLQDITAHVDFTAVAEAGVDAGARLSGYTTQARFLLNCGIAELLAGTPADDVATYLPQTAAVQKLLSPAETGEIFKVIALSRNTDLSLLGFRDGDLTRML